LGAEVGIDADFFDDKVSPLGTDTVDVTERERDFLLRGDFDAEETWHSRMGWC
jgi:hypothetical protein